MRTKLFSLLFSLALPSGLALAQEGDPGPVFVDEGSGEQDPTYIEQDESGYVADDGYVDDGTGQQGEYVADPNDPNAGYVEEQRPERPGRQLSLALDVPFFLTNASDIGAGVGAHLRFGYELGMLVPQVKFGASTNFLTEDGELLTGEANLNAIWASLGARLQILNRSRFVPVIDAGLRLQFWNYSNPTDGGTARAFEPGISVGAGLAIEITATFGLEVGVELVMAFPTSDTFLGYDNEGTQFFLMPHIGGTLYL